MPARLIPRAGGSTRRHGGAESGPISGSGLRWERWVPGLPRRVLPARFPAPISESMWVYRPMCQGPGSMSLMFSEINVGNWAGMLPSGARVQHRSPACGGGGWWLLPALVDAWDCGASCVRLQVEVKLGGIEIGSDAFIRPMRCIDLLPGVAVLLGTLGRVQGNSVVSFHSSVAVLPLSAFGRILCYESILCTKQC